LRSIKQIGLAEYVFPCATHTPVSALVGRGFFSEQLFREFGAGLGTAPRLSIAEPSGGTVFHTKQTEDLNQVHASTESYQFWYRATVMAGLLHDVGHGPLSHTFEYLICSRILPRQLRLLRVVREFLKAQAAAGRLMHEDISVLYVGLILKDLEKAGGLTEGRGARFHAYCLRFGETKTRRRKIRHEVCGRTRPGRWVKRAAIRN
jgi:hypothetical protein